MTTGEAALALGDEDLCEELRYFAQKTLRRELEDFGIRLQRSMAEELQRFICGPRVASRGASSPTSRPQLAPLATATASLGEAPLSSLVGASPASAADSAVEERAGPQLPGSLGCCEVAMDSTLPGSPYVAGSPDTATASDVLRMVCTGDEASPLPPGKKTSAASLSRRRSWSSDTSLPPEAFQGPKQRDTDPSKEDGRNTVLVEEEPALLGSTEATSQRHRTTRRRSSPISRVRSRSNSDVEQLPTFIGFKPSGAGERSLSLSRSSTTCLEMSPGVAAQRRHSFDASFDAVARVKGSVGRSRSQSLADVELLKDMPSLLVSNKDIGSPMKEKAAAEDSEAVDADLQLQRAESLSGISNISSTPDGTFDRVHATVVRFVENSKFDWGSGVLVSLNAISIGWQTDYMATQSTDHPPTAFRVFDGLFCLVFVAELALRILAYGKDFFFGVEWRWNLFDVATVAMQIFEEITTLVAVTTHDEHHATGSNFSYLRLLRLVRLVRVLRIVRVLRFIRELRKLVCSIGNSLQSLAWTIVLLVFMLYVVGVCFTQLVSNHLRYASSLSSNDATLHEQFGSLGSSVLSLFQAMSGGVDWEDLSRPLRDVHWTLEVLFALYIAFAVLAMLNVVTGVFVDSAVQSSTKDQENDFVLRMRELYSKTLLNEDGRLTWGAFERQLQKKDVKDYFQNVGINVAEAWSLFELLDVDDSGEIDMDEFVMGCLRLRGPAKSVDLVTLMYDNKRMLGKLHGQFDDVSRFLQAQMPLSPSAPLGPPPAGRPTSSTSSPSRVRRASFS